MGRRWNQVLGKMVDDDDDVGSIFSKSSRIFPKENDCLYVPPKPLIFEPPVEKPFRYVPDPIIIPEVKPFRYVAPEIPKFELPKRVIPEPILIKTEPIIPRISGLNEDRFNNQEEERRRQKRLDDEMALKIYKDITTMRSNYYGF